MELAVEFRLDEELPAYPRQATLVPPPGGYPWGSPHNDEYARKVLGFRGGLVPGATLLAYISEFMVQLFGQDWFTSGTITAQFIGGGIVDKDQVAIHARVVGIEPEADRQRITLEYWMERRDDFRTAVAGTASSIH